MRILITGGCGYIGSALVPLLIDSQDVSHLSVFDNLSGGSPRNLLGSGLDTTQNIAFIRGDVRQYGEVEAAMRDIDTVIHLAAITGAASTHDRRDETLAVNADGTENVLQAAGKLGVSNVVLASSCNVYGRAPTTDIDETTAPDPLNPYAESKLTSEQLLKDAAEEYGFDATALRMSTNYGLSPGIRFNLVVNHFVFRAITDRPLTVYGDGNNWRPFIHVRDAARAYAHASRHPNSWPSTIYNVGQQTQNFQIEEIAEAVRDTLDSALNITYLRDAHPGPSYHVNFDRLSETTFECEYTLTDGISELATAFDQSSPLQ